jgi:hypothetical protein
VAGDWQGSVVDRSGEITHVNPAPEQSFHFFLNRALNTPGPPKPWEKLPLLVLLIDRNGITWLIMPEEEQDLLRALGTSRPRE